MMGEPNRATTTTYLSPQKSMLINCRDYHILKDRFFLLLLRSFQSHSILPYPCLPKIFPAPIYHLPTSPQFAIMKYNLSIDPNSNIPPTRDLPTDKTVADRLPDAKEVKVHPSRKSGSGNENASLFFVGTATCILFVLLFLLSPFCCFVCPSSLAYLLCVVSFVAEIDGG